jgi:tRNA(Ile)-lysidine synthase
MGLALSGGGDSVALMYLLEAWARQESAALPVAFIVDHGLRRGSAAEAAQVALWARGLGFDAEVLRWKGAKPRSNVEEQAREARYALLGDACARKEVSLLLVAHTREDLAETFLLRLGRGSGLDGLAAMPVWGRLPASGYASVALVRPLLDFGRAELRAYAAARGAAWIEDPMNEDPRFARTRMRRLLPELEREGVSVTRIVQAARHLGRAREALEDQTRAFLKRHARKAEDGMRLDVAALATAPREIGLRVLADVLMQVSGRQYRPRFERLERLYGELTAGRPPRARTLHGCRIGRAPRKSQDFGPATFQVTKERARQASLRREKAPERAHSRARM